MSYIYVIPESGRELELEDEYLGDANRQEIFGWPDNMDRGDNYNHHILSVTTENGETASFDWWASQMNPGADSFDDLCDILRTVVDDAITYYNDELGDYMNDSWTFNQCKIFEKTIEEEVRELEKLDLTEDELYAIANDRI